MLFVYIWLSIVGILTLQNELQHSGITIYNNFWYDKGTRILLLINPILTTKSRFNWFKQKNVEKTKRNGLVWSWAMVKSVSGEWGWCSWLCAAWVTCRGSCRARSALERREAHRCLGSPPPWRCLEPYCRPRKSVQNWTSHT